MSSSPRTNRPLRSRMTMVSRSLCLICRPIPAFSRKDGSTPVSNLVDIDVYENM